MAARPTLPPAEDGENPAEGALEPPTSELTDPLAVAREGLVDVDQAAGGKRRLFGRRRDPGGHAAERTPDAHADEPLVVFDDASWPAPTPAEPAPSASLSVEDLPEPPRDEIFTETATPLSFEAPAELIPVARPVELPSVTPTISAAAVRGTFPRRTKSTNQGDSAPAGAGESASTSALEVAERIRNEAEDRAATAERQAAEAERAVQAATERALNAERRAGEAEQAAAAAHQLADQHAQRLAEVQNQLAEASSSKTDSGAEDHATAAHLQTQSEIDAEIAQIRTERDAALAREARLHEEFEALAAAEAQARKTAEQATAESSVANARARAESRARAEAEAAAKSHADALAVAEDQLRQAQDRLAQVESSVEAARVLAMQAADQIVAVAAERLKTETARRTAAEARAEAAEAELRASAEELAQKSAAADEVEQARVEAAAAHRSDKRREAVAALDAINNAIHKPAPADSVTDEWSFEELETANWAVTPEATAPAASSSTDHPREAEGEMDRHQSETGRRGRFHLKRHKNEDGESESTTDPGRTPVETLADYVAAQGLEVPEELRQQAPAQELEAKAEGTPVAEAATAATPVEELPAAPSDELWTEPDSDDAAPAKTEEQVGTRGRGLLRRRTHDTAESSAPAAETPVETATEAPAEVPADEPVAGPVDLEPEVTGTMEPADAPAEAASEESTDHPAHEEQQVSEESTTNEQADDHVWTAAELAAEGWTTADLKGAGWTDAHLESIGWPLDDKAEEPADEDAHAEETPEEESEDEPAKAVEPEADQVEDTSEKADDATAPAAEDGHEEAEPTLPGLESSGTAESEAAVEPEAASAEPEAADEEPKAEEKPAEEPAPEPVVAAEPEPTPAAEPEPAPVAAAEPEPTPAPVAEPEPAPTSVPAAAIPALTMQDLTPDEIERALMLGESLSDILARKNAALQTSAPAAAAESAVGPATASTSAAQEPAGSEPSPEHSTSASGGGDRGGDDSDDPDPDPAVALVEPEAPVAVSAPEPEPEVAPEPQPWTEAHTTVLPKIVDEPAAKPVEAPSFDSAAASSSASQIIASEAATETGATDAERIEYRPGNGRRYLFGTAFIAAAVLSVVAVFWAIQNPGIAPSVTAGCLVVLTGALWWSLMAWSPRIIAIGHGVLEFAQGGHVERFNLLDPDTNIAVGADPTSRTWRAEVVRANGTKIVVRPDDVRPQQFSSLIAKYREEAEAARH